MLHQSSNQPSLHSKASHFRIQPKIVYTSSASRSAWKRSLEINTRHVAKHRKLCKQWRRFFMSYRGHSMLLTLASTYVPQTGWLTMTVIVKTHVRYGETITAVVWRELTVIPGCCLRSQFNSPHSLPLTQHRMSSYFPCTAAGQFLGSRNTEPSLKRHEYMLMNTPNTKQGKIEFPAYGDTCHQRWRPLLSRTCQGLFWEKAI